MTEPLAPALPPGSTIGILGGGQLGRMLALAAAPLGLRVHVYGPDVTDGPAAQVSGRATDGGWDDVAVLERFARATDVVTFEWENVPLATADAVARHAPLRPGNRALETCQDRLAEKRFLQSCGLAVAPFAAIEDAASLERAREAIGPEGILKTRRFGYDGKGQCRVHSGDRSREAWEAMRGAPSIYEGLVDFEHEISVVAARGIDGRTAAFEPGENLHEGGILRRTTVPARLADDARAAAFAAADRVLAALDYVGVLGLELFVTKGGIVANEIAPRVHNSGHWTQDGCLVSQFEQHIRAVAGWPLGDPARHSDIEMTNLIGDDIEGALAIAAEPGAALHLYGKTEARPGRKMGHVNRRIGAA